MSARTPIKIRSNDRSTGAAGFKGFGMLPNKRKQNTGTYHWGKSRYFLQCGYPLALLADFQKCGKSVNLYRFTLLANLWSCTALPCLPLFASRKWWANNFQMGNCFAVSPVVNSSTNKNPLFWFLNLWPTWEQVIFILCELAEILLSDNLSGSYDVTSDQLGPKWYVDMHISKQWKVVPLSQFLKISLRDILQKCLQGKHSWNPLNSIADTGCTIFIIVSEKELRPKLRRSSVSLMLFILTQF